MLANALRTLFVDFAQRVEYYRYDGLAGAFVEDVKGPRRSGQFHGSRICPDNISSPTGVGLDHCDLHSLPSAKRAPTTYACKAKFLLCSGQAIIDRQAGIIS